MINNLFIRESCTYPELEKALKERNDDKKYDFEKIKKAFEFANSAHSEQLRKSGQPYITHPLSVAFTLVHLGLDTDSITAALLHDVVEDTSVSLEEVEELFGEDVAALTDGVTKLGKIPFSSREEQQAENVRKMFIAMSRDIRVIIIKLADRLHNMHTIKYLKEQKQRDKARETMEVYAPIAHRLGIRAVKEFLEDVALRCLDPIGYENIAEALQERLNGRETFIEDIVEEISNKLNGRIENFEIYGRIKSINGVYRKVYGKGRAIGEIYDIYAFRVIVDSINDCYHVLGLIHDMYNPIPNRFKDYISMPKANLYQSLHTTVISEKATPFEVQIRTREMHKTAEYGIAAHWKYKLGINKSDSFEKRVAWIRQMIESQKDIADVSDVLQNIKTDLMPEDVFVFTPKGEVKNLPTGSTVVDFAYSIHTDVGNRMIGAKANGRIVTLDYKLKTGDVISILTSKELNKGPSRDWLNIVKTSTARSKIRSWFKKEKRDENIAEGKAEIELNFRRNRIYLSDSEFESFLNDLSLKHHFNSVNDFYAAIGYGGIQLRKMMPRIKDSYLKMKQPQKAEVLPQTAPETQQKNKSQSGITIDGIDDCLIKFSKCCNPLPGDEIIGFITRGHGVSIHKTSCKNVPDLNANSSLNDRWIKANWNNGENQEFISHMEILVTNREGLLADITVKLSMMHIFITNMSSRAIKNGKGIVDIAVKVKNKKHMDRIQEKIESIDGVISVKRD